MPEQSGRWKINIKWLRSLPSKDGANNPERIDKMRITEYRTKINKENNLNELVKEKVLNYQTDIKALTSPDAIANMMNAVYYMNERAEEYLFMIALDTKNKPIGVFEISHGTVNSSLLSPREVFIRAILAGAVSIVLIHNHPSGDPAPSREDIQVTKRISEVGQLMGIKLLDHIIIGDYYKSLREEGII